MSPGIRRISKKTNAAAPTRVGITSSIRFTMYRYIVSPVIPAKAVDHLCSDYPLLVEPHGGQVLIAARRALPKVPPPSRERVPPSPARRAAEGRGGAMQYLTTEPRCRRPNGPAAARAIPGGVACSSRPQSDSEDET